MSPDAEEQIAGSAAHEAKGDRGGDRGGQMEIWDGPVWMGAGLYIIANTGLSGLVSRSEGILPGEEWG